jgi:hypothetical protein
MPSTRANLSRVSAYWQLHGTDSEPQPQTGPRAYDEKPISLKPCVNSKNVLIFLPYTQASHTKAVPTRATVICGNTICDDFESKEKNHT